mmetsp:Transcript_29838/g.28997  ORF Transcript_29838/g.28997 Transcript_29838/m.28997 type:complete len:155 (+) Transcript_29838:361-825(+)
MLTTPRAELMRKMLDLQDHTLSSKFFQEMNEAKKILLVDDDPLNLYALGLLFESQGNYRCEQAKNGEEAIKKVMEGEFRLIVMDMNMPIMNGMEATKELRKLHVAGEVSLSRTLIFIHSAISCSIQWQEIFDGKLSKPVCLDEIKAALDLIKDL